MNNFYRTALLSSALALTSISANAATMIGIGGISDAITETFDGTATGAILGTDPIFSALGITAITGTSDTGDSYGNRPLSSRALGLNASGLQIVDPGVGVGLFRTATISFASAITQFGFGVSDQAGNYAINFFNGATLVDSTTFNTTTTDLENFGFAALAFDSVTISQGNGFALDNLTVSAIAPVPVPASLGLMIAGLGALGLARRKHAKS